MFNLGPEPSYWYRWFFSSLFLGINRTFCECDGREPCPCCSGGDRNWVTAFHTLGTSVEEQPCRICNGEGFTRPSQCRICDGRGIIEHTNYGRNAWPDGSVVDTAFTGRANLLAITLWLDDSMLDTWDDWQAFFRQVAKEFHGDTNGTAL